MFDKYEKYQKKYVYKEKKIGSYNVFITSNNLLYINDKLYNISHIPDKNTIIQYRKTIIGEYLCISNK